MTEELSMFAVRDIVYLNSGSPPLTVVDIEFDIAAGKYRDTMITVAWIDSEGHPQVLNAPWKCFRYRPS